MIVVDTSALIAIIEKEPERQAFSAILSATDGIAMSAMTYFEAMMVMSRRRVDGHLDVESLVDQLNIQIEPFTETDAALAHDAFLRFGRGSGHPAKLNFGDCAAYALSRRRREPLLFKGADFAATDVATAAGLTPPPAP